MLGMLLRTRGVSDVTFAEDGQVAVDLVRSSTLDNQPFTLIFMDNTMPNKVIQHVQQAHPCQINNF